MNKVLNTIQRLRPEINHIYHEPTVLGFDGGWFCREHAFHTYFLLSMFGIESSIVGGDIAVVFDFTRKLNSFGSSHKNGHYWNKTSDTNLLDTSLSFEYVWDPSLNIDLVADRDLSGNFMIIPTADEIMCRDFANRSQSMSICYYEREVLKPTHDELLKNPYSFLVRPPSEALTGTHGADIFNRITLHLYNVARGVTKPLYPTGMPFDKTLKAIRARTKNATNKVAGIIDSKK